MNARFQVFDKGCGRACVMGVRRDSAEARALTAWLALLNKKRAPSRKKSPARKSALPWMGGKRKNIEIGLRPDPLAPAATVGGKPAT
jgi:hypothetical protein